MRVGEVNDVDYHFVTVDKFRKMINNNMFFEHVTYSSNFYGTCKNDAGSHKVLIVEPNYLPYLCWGYGIKVENPKNILAFESLKDIQEL